MRYSHTPTLFEPETLKSRVQRAAAGLASFDFHAIAARGLSGTVFAGALSVAINKPLILVRKPGAMSHSALTVEGSYSLAALNPLRWIFVDDFISSGETWLSVSAAITSSHHHHLCVGGWLYQCVEGQEWHEGIAIGARRDYSSL